MSKITYEQELEPEVPQTDTIYVFDGRGNFIAKVVEDDAGDN